MLYFQEVGEGLGNEGVGSDGVGSDGVGWVGVSTVSTTAVTDVVSTCQEVSVCAYQQQLQQQWHCASVLLGRIATHTHDA